ncbi:hypothetical protein Fmac_008383 [Flemingia macrophylla]|uniref:Aconitase/3-isopropylmalate dehydratase large subunit alpha/beta/alpha domain-containing protein n=1 Tax=Flemingia macrophylla TaxID=520843 RepID=A0ABD1MYF5_9FABA
MSIFRALSKTVSICRSLSRTVSICRALSSDHEYLSRPLQDGECSVVAPPSSASPDSTWLIGDDAAGKASLDSTWLVGDDAVNETPVLTFQIRSKLWRLRHWVNTAPFDFSVFFKVVYICLSFQMAPESHQKEVYNSSYGQNSAPIFQMAPEAPQKDVYKSSYAQTSAPMSRCPLLHSAHGKRLEPRMSRPVFLALLSFHIVGFGCTTCIGNSRDLDPTVASAISENDIVAFGILLGNRNFVGHVHPLTKVNYLASPPLVIVASVNLDEKVKAPKIVVETSWNFEM